jgi:hypothetical protein
VRDTVHTETIIKEIDTVYTTKTRFFQKWDFDSIYFVVERDTIVRDSVVRDTLIIRLQDTLSVLPSDSLGKTLFTNAYFGQDTTDHYSLNWAIGIKENELVYFEPVITVNPGTKCTIKQAVKDWWKSLKRK